MKVIFNDFVACNHYCRAAYIGISSGFWFGATDGMNVSSVTSADSRIGYRVDVKGDVSM